MAINLRTDLLLLGKNVPINKNITLFNPTISQIFEYGEEKYFKTISEFVSTSYQCMLFLHRQGINYLEVSDYEIFRMICSGMDKERSSILFGDLDFSSLDTAYDYKTKQIVMLDGDSNIIIDEPIYHVLVEYIRKIHNIERVFKKPANEHTMKIYIREAEKEEMIAKKRGYQPFESVLEPIISSLCNNYNFKYNHFEVGQLPLYTLLDSLKRIQLYDNVQHITRAIYNGTVDGKSIKHNELNWCRKL